MGETYVYKLLEAMSEEYFCLFKDRIRQYHVHLCSKKNQLGYSLFDLICAENVLPCITKIQLAKVLNELMAEQLCDSKWFTRYIDELYNYVPDEEEKLYLSGRGKKYYDYAGNKINELKNTYGKNSEITDDYILTLIDLVKIIISINALNDYNSGIHKVTDNLDFEMTPVKTRTLLKQVASSIEKGEEEEESSAIPEDKVAKSKPKFPGIKIELPKDPKAMFKPKHTLKYQEKLAALILTWLLFYRICEQDGIPAKEVKE